MRKEEQVLKSNFMHAIGTLNCGHAAFPIVMGVSEPRYTEEELEQFRADNERGVTVDGRHYTGCEAVQERQRLERAVRTQKRRVLVDKAAGDEEKLLTDQIRLKRYEQEHSRFSKAAGLQTERERVQTAGAGRGEVARAAVVSKKAEAAALAREKALKFIQDDAIIKAKSGMPKKIVNMPDERLRHTVNVDIDKTPANPFEFHAVAPKGADMKSVEVMAGAGTSTPIRDLKRLYATYGLDPDGWQKKSGTVFGENYHYVIHWYEHNGMVPIDEIKLKGMKKNK